MPTFPELERCLLRLVSMLRSAERMMESLGGALMMRQFTEEIGWRPLPPDTCDCCVAAVDSSFAAFETRLCVVYVVQGLAISSRGASVKGADAGTIAYSPSIEQGRFKVSPKRVVSAIAQLLEIELVSKAIEDSGGVDYALMDGSALSFLLSKVGKVLSERIVNSVVRGSRIDVSTLCRAKLRRLTKLADRAVFVAKSSGLSLAMLGLSSVGSLVAPDLSMLEIARLANVEPLRRAGVSKVFRVRIEGRIARSLGLDDYDLEMLRSRGIDTVSVMYVRIRDGAPAFQVSMLGDVDESRVAEVVRCLARWSPLGYPVPLESVHRLSKLRRRVIKSLLRSLAPAVSGREVLE
ncbi:MAG: DNA double-strand break repair nuclease NurA [Crenarchaeota archaeon]|nr:DNA double-strand break repair nuclease NurA [Thermoproteota archaeon]